MTAGEREISVEAKRLVITLFLDEILDGGGAVEVVQSGWILDNLYFEYKPNRIS